MLLILRIKLLKDELNKTKYLKDNEINVLNNKLYKTKFIEQGLWVFFIMNENLPGKTDAATQEARRKYIDFHKDEIYVFDQIMRKYRGTPKEIRYPFMKNARKVAKQMLENAKRKQAHSRGMVFHSATSVN